MRHHCALGLVLLLTGCVSERHFIRDSWPFGNPNAPPATSETGQRALGHDVSVTVIVPQAGNVWPGPVRQMPTISDIEKNANQPLGQGFTPSLPSPYPPGETPPDAVVPPLPAINATPSVPINPGGPLSGPLGAQGGVVAPTQSFIGQSPPGVPFNGLSATVPGRGIGLRGAGAAGGGQSGSVGGASSSSSSAP